VEVKVEWCRSVRLVMSRGRSVSVRDLRSGMGVVNASLENALDDEVGAGGDGGRVDDGSGEVRENTSAAARGSVWMLNSARGVICTFLH
jgi:hypothetical protein